MEHLKKVVGINLLVLLVMTGVLFADSKSQYEGSMLYSIGMAILIIFQVAINIIIGIVQYFRNKPNVKSYFIAMLVVLVVGFSFCVGGSSMR